MYKELAVFCIFLVVLGNMSALPKDVCERLQEKWVLLSK